MINSLKTDENEDVRCSAVEALGKLNNSHAVEPLINALKKDKSKDVQKYAVEVLKKLSKSGVKIPKEVKTLLNVEPQ